MSNSIVGFLESISQAGIRGWAFRPQDVAPLKLTLRIDGTPLDQFTCDYPREDAYRQGHVHTQSMHGAALGFIVEVPASFYDDQLHDFDFLTEFGEPVVLAAPASGRSSCWQFTFPSRTVLSEIELGEAGKPIHGWAIVLSRHGEARRTENDISVVGDNGWITRIKANRPRPDVATVLGCGPLCGFMLDLPDAVRFGPKQMLHLRVVPEDLELNRSPISVGGEMAPVLGAGAMSIAALNTDWLDRLPDTNAADMSLDQPDPGVLCTRFDTQALFGIAAELAEIESAAAWPTILRPLQAGHHNALEQVIATELDSTYYLLSHPELHQRGIDPVSHYAQEGWKAGLWPTPWFDTSFYLEANTDVNDLNINPFWHYLVNGREEGRLTQRPGSFRRQVVDGALVPAQRAAHYVRPTAVPQLLNTYLHDRLTNAFGGAGGVVLSVSHDCYIRSTGGVQILIADEQARYREKGYAYLHISPVNADLILAAEDSAGMLQMVLNGAYLGITTYDELMGALSTATRAAWPVLSDRHERIFIIHCLLGHIPEKLPPIQRALRATKNYFWLHDFSSVCEGYNLLRNDAFFCGAPPASSLACRVCVCGATRERHQARLHALFQAVSLVVVAPSRSALATWHAGTSLPHADALVHPHCTIQVNARRASIRGGAKRGTPENPVRVAYIGYPAVHKGWPLFKALAARLELNRCYRFYHFAGPESWTGTGPAIEKVAAQTSQSDRGAMTDALANQVIDLVLVLAPWPETFSYVTYESLAAGADVVTLVDSGNVADAVLTLKRGVVMLDDAALFAFFESYRAVVYVRRCYEQGMEGGSLIHTGTTATIEHQSDLREMEDAE